MDQSGAKDRPTIVIIGSGNVATHLSKGLEQSGCQIKQVYSRHLNNANQLASQLNNCEAIDDIALICQDADLYLVSVKDAAVSEIAHAMPHVTGIVAHTSGSVNIDVLSSCSDRFAVFYPLQTFSKEAMLDLNTVPLFTEASDNLTLETIDAYARRLSKSVFHANSDQRKILHIAGVLSCNFVNYLWDCTEDVLATAGYNLEVVEPLVRVTLDKAFAIGPHKAQTGPAMRGDREVISEHMSKLSPQVAALYGDLSEAIIKSHQDE